MHGTIQYELQGTGIPCTWSVFYRQGKNKIPEKMYKKFVRNEPGHVGGKFFKKA